jgi:hypothetical protein
MRRNCSYPQQSGKLSGFSCCSISCMPTRRLRESNSKALHGARRDADSKIYSLQLPFRAAQKLSAPGSSGAPPPPAPPPGMGGPPPGQPNGLPPPPPAPVRARS